MISLEVQEKLGRALSAQVAGFGDADRTRVSAAMGGEVRSLIVRHLTELAGSRHPTANRLGASPTGYIGNLVEDFDQSSVVSVDADGVSISMRHPVISRAVRDVTITPSKQFLTIPLNALAYGRRAGEFDKVQLIRQGAGGSGGGGKKKERKPLDPSIPAFLLVRSVTQKRDPSLLPTFDEINHAAAVGAARETRAILTEQGLL